MFHTTLGYYLLSSQYIKKIDRHIGNKIIICSSIASSLHAFQTTVLGIAASNNIYIKNETCKTNEKKTRNEFGSLQSPRRGDKQINGQIYRYRRRLLKENRCLLEFLWEKVLAKFIKGRENSTSRVKNYFCARLWEPPACLKCFLNILLRVLYS